MHTQTTYTSKDIVAFLAEKHGVPAADVSVRVKPPYSGGPLEHYPGDVEFIVTIPGR